MYSEPAMNLAPLIRSWPIAIRPQSFSRYPPDESSASFIIHGSRRSWTLTNSPPSRASSVGAEALQLDCREAYEQRLLEAMQPLNDNALSHYTSYNTHIKYMLTPTSSSPRPLRRATTPCHRCHTTCSSPTYAMRALSSPHTLCFRFMVQFQPAPGRSRFNPSITLKIRPPGLRPVRACKAGSWPVLSALL
ncbi:hypothetical protein T492DRAFT_1142360 [Pavlovales sp. CCMP2436]|nr:hypothetical protein T492DRAFT_1142360 [Pavlovales sp. CCMP2436]